MIDMIKGPSLGFKNFVASPLPCPPRQGEG